MVAASPATDQASGGRMRIGMLDGLRGWLAWTVVASHLVQITALDRTHANVWITQFLAREAVSVFIIISGFVICELVLTRREAWWPFITRRAFRLFPIYLALLPFGFLSMYLALEALGSMNWAGHPRFLYDDTLRETEASVTAAPAAHILAHLTMLHGVVPDTLFDKMQTSFLAPAWSLSLEWQFYLIAPALIWALQHPGARLAAMVAIIAAAALTSLGAFGTFGLPSFLPASIHYFLIGIGTRLLWPHLASLPFALVALILFCVLLTLFFRALLAPCLWIAMIALITSEGRVLRRYDAATRRAAGLLFDSPLARRMGAYSYAIYLAHWPILQTAAFLLLPLGDFSQVEALVLLSLAVVPATLLAAHLLHFCLEKPMIRIGARVAAHMTTRTRLRTGEAVEPTQ